MKYLIYKVLIVVLFSTLPVTGFCEINIGSSELNTAYSALVDNEKDVFSSFSLRIIEWYQQRISPFSGPECFFYPTCSGFIKQAIIRYGFFTGILMGIDRLFYREGRSSLDYYPLYNPGEDSLFDEWIEEDKKLDSPETVFDPVYHNFIFNPEDYYMSSQDYKETRF